MANKRDNYTVVLKKSHLDMSIITPELNLSVQRISTIMVPLIKTLFSKFIVNTNGCFDDVKHADGTPLGLASVYR